MPCSTCQWKRTMTDKICSQALYNSELKPDQNSACQNFATVAARCCKQYSLGSVY